MDEKNPSTALSVFSTQDKPDCQLLISKIAPYFIGIYSVDIENDRIFCCYDKNHFLEGYINESFIDTMSSFADEMLAPADREAFGQFIINDMINVQMEGGITPRTQFRLIDGKTISLSIIAADNYSSDNKTTWWLFEEKHYLSHDEQIKNIRDVLEAVSIHTDDYLFVADLSRYDLWFYGDIGKIFPICEEGDPHTTFHKLYKYVHSADRHKLKNNLRDVANGIVSTHDLVYRWIDRNNKPVWVRGKGSIVYSDKGEMLALTGRLSTSLKHARFDSLTGLYNQRAMLEYMEDKLPQFDNGYVLIFGIDNLTRINIKNGRNFGNQILKNAAEIIETEAAAINHIYRLSGDRFALFIENAATCSPDAVFSKISKALSGHCSVSAGVVNIIADRFKDLNSLYLCMEIALNKAKAKGKGCIEYFTDTDYEVRLSEIELIDELSYSAEHGCDGFYLCYQPQINAKDCSLHGAEALLRYRSAERGQFFPDKLIPILERTELIIPVGLWIIRTALENCKKWRETYPDFHVSVNLSNIQMRTPSIAADVLNILAESGLPGSALTVEITESIQLQEFEYCNEVFEKWRAEGIEVSLDDFGTGYSSLSYLQKLYINEIKIDRIFVSNIQEKTYNFRLINHMIELAKNNAIHICCEGVETTKELEVLEGLGPDFYQGYMFDKPLEADIFDKAYIDVNSEEYCQRKQFIENIREHRRNYGIISLDRREILRNCKLGLWIIRLEADSSWAEMYADEVMEHNLGLERKLTPSECYYQWFDRIHKDYIPYVTKLVTEMINSNKTVELQYPWIHPVNGEVMVRCIGKRVSDTNGKITLQGYHTIVSDWETYKKDN